MAAAKRHAVVFGASGVTGWSVVNQLLLDYPKVGTWGKVTALTNRPLSLGVSQWPESGILNIVSGLNLLEQSQDVFNEAVKKEIPDIATVTHVFYYGESDPVSRPFTGKLELKIPNDSLQSQSRFPAGEKGFRLYAGPSNYCSGPALTEPTVCGLSDGSKGKPTLHAWRGYAKAL